MGTESDPSKVLFPDIMGAKAREFVLRQVAHCQPDRVHICDGSEEEYKQLLVSMEKEGMIERLPKYDNCWLVRTDPRDVARVEEKTYICTEDQREAVPIPKEGIHGHLGKWESLTEFDKDYEELFRACMHGRVMYVIPFSMGPIGGPLSKIGIEITDSPYVVACMRVMTRVGNKVLETLGDNDFVKALHSVGQPLPMKQPPFHGWPCNPEHTVIAQIPSRNEIISFGSGYGGNSLLGKKCFSLRIGSCIARREGWLAEHMLIFGITNPQGKKHYIAAAFPSCCGKTNLAMLKPSLPGYKIEVVGDDIAWMKFDAEGRLRGINPEAGFFGVAPGTNEETNPNAMATFRKDTIFTNVAKTDDGGYYWEGMKLPDAKIEDWLGNPWEPGCGRPASHPNARFTAPADHCPIIDPLWEHPKGVPIDAILFGGRRPEGIPLVYESFDWHHGVFVGATVRSEATKAAEDHGTQILHDPFAMRPFFGYNFGKYVEHWMTMKEQHPNAMLPKIFHVNWFRKDKNGKFIWPGFGDNIRVLEWVMRRVEGDDVAEDRPYGRIPKPGSIPVDGLHPAPDMEELFRFDKNFWVKEVKEMRQYFEEQAPNDTPKEIWDQIAALEKRVQEFSG